MELLIVIVKYSSYVTDCIDIKIATDIDFSHFIAYVPNFLPSTGLQVAQRHSRWLMLIQISPSKTI